MRADLTSGLRQLRRNPALATAAVVVLAIGLGASLTVFAWAQWLVLRPFPGVRQSGEFRALVARTANWRDLGFSAPDFRDLERDGAGIVVASAFEMQAMSLLNAAGAPERVWGGVVSGGFFDLLRLRPALGRFFLPEEDVAAGERAVAVLSHRAWTTRFAADPTIVGRAVTLNNRPFTVVGVAPAGFYGTEVGLSLDLWVPLSMQEAVYPGRGRLQSRGDHWLRVLARPADGRTEGDAAGFLASFGERLRRDFPGELEGVTFSLVRLWEAPWGATQFMAPVMAILGAMVGLVVLTTCANVAGLLLVRGIGRRREFAIRRALGAGRLRLVRQTAVESLVLAVLAAAAGLVFTMWAKGSIYGLFPPIPVPVNMDLEIGPTTVALAVLLALVTATLAGLAPALQAGRASVESALRDEAGAIAVGRARARGRKALVTLQVALSFVLLVSGALLLRAVGAGRAVDPGFRAPGLLLAGLDLFPNGYDRARGLELQQRLLERLEEHPAVESATLSRRLMLDLGGSSSAGLRIDGYQPAPGEDLMVRFNRAAAGYFRTLGIDVLAGRDLSPADRDGTPLVAVVNQTMASRFWPGDRALGGIFEWGDSKVTVVGVARDVKQRDLAERPEAFFWLSTAQFYHPEAYLHVRTRHIEPGAPLDFVPELRRIVAELDPNLPLYAVKSMDEHLKISLFKQTLSSRVLGAFGAVGLVLAGVGLYGVVAFAVGQRRRELALRLALGARPADVRRLVFAEGSRLVAVGLVIGAGLAVAAAFGLRGLLLGLRAFDPAAFGASLALLGAVVALAVFLPARRAARLEPSEALRHE